MSAADKAEGGPGQTYPGDPVADVIFVPQVRPARGIPRAEQSAPAPSARGANRR